MIDVALIGSLKTGFIPFQAAFALGVLSSWARLGVGLQFGVDVGLREIVGVIAQGGECYAHHDIYGLLFAVACGDECGEFGIGNCAFVCHHGDGEIGKGFEFGIVKLGGIDVAGCLDGLLGQQFF